MGTTGDPNVDQGIIPRAVKSIFAQLNALSGPLVLPNGSGLRPPSRFGNTNGNIFIVSAHLLTR